MTMRIMFVLTMRDEDGTNYLTKHGWQRARFDVDMREHCLIFANRAYAEKRAAMLEADLSANGPKDWVRGPVRVREIKYA